MEKRIYYVKGVYDTTPKSADSAMFLQLHEDSELRKVYDEIQAHIAKEGYKHKDAFIQRRKSSREIPAMIAAVSEFDGHGRKVENVKHVTGNMIIDLDDISMSDFLIKIDAAAERLGISRQDLYRREGILYVSKSLTGGGLTLIIKRAREKSISEMMDAFAARWDVKVDEQCKDITRLKFLSVKENVEWCDTERLFSWESDEEESYWLNFVEPSSSAESESGQKDIDQVAHCAQQYTEMTYDGIPMKRLVRCIMQVIKDYDTSKTNSELRRSIEIDGDEVRIAEGSRHAAQVALAKILRHAMDYNTDRLAAAIPRWDPDQSEEKVHSIARAYCTRTANRSPLLDRAIAMARGESSEENEAQVMIDAQFDPFAMQLPVHCLNSFFKKFLAKVPRESQIAMLHCILCVLGSYCSGFKYKHLDGSVRSLSFIVVLCGPPACGKSTILSHLRPLLRVMDEEDASELAREEAYKKALKKAKNTQEQPEEYVARIHHLGENITQAKILKRMSNVRGEHCLIVAQQLQNMQLATNSQYNDTATMLLYSFNNELYGNDRLNDESFSGLVPVYLNVVAAATESERLASLPPADDGLLTRIIFCPLRENDDDAMPVWAEYTPLEHSYFRNKIEYLRNVDVCANIPQLNRAFDEWRISKRQYARQTGSSSAKAFTNRCVEMGMRAAYVAYLTSEMKEIKKSIEFGLWVSEYAYRTMMYYYGYAVDQLTSRATVKVGGVHNVYQSLPTTFSRANLIEEKTKVGESISDASIRKTLSSWKNLIKKNGDGTYSKVTV